MAARFWVGGTGTWDATTTTNWSATSGGASGASVPGAADDVTIDSNFTVTTNYNVSVISVTTNAATATLSLGGTLTCSGAITLTQGTFTTNNFNVTATSLSSSNSNTRTINLGSSTVTLSSSTPFSAATNTNLTFNAGTSTITFSGAGTTITGGAISATGVTFYNVSFTTTAASTHSIQSVNTFNNLTVTAPAAAGVTQVTFNSRQTINGTLSTTGTAGNCRVWFRSAAHGIAHTLTINSAPSLTDADFRDIYVIGTAAPISGTRIGNRAGCSGITFSTAKTVYWVTLAGGNWSSTSWSNASGGTASDIYFPLAQDTATFVNTGLNAAATVTLDAPVAYMGTFDMTARTNAMTLAGSTNYTVYGDLKLSTAITINFNGGFLFSGRNTQSIISASKNFQQPITIDSYGGTVELADAFSIGNSALNILNGTFDTKNYSVSVGTLQSNASNVRAINLGSSAVTLLSTTPVDFSTFTNLTVNAGTSTLSCSFTGAVTFNAGNTTLYNVSFASTSSGTSLTITGNTFNNITINPPASGVCFCLLTGNLTINGTFTCAGATAVSRIFVRSDTLGTARTLTVGTLAATDCDFRDITLAGAAAGSSPTRAGDCGGNTSITFSTKTVYWNLAGAQNWSATGWATSSGGAPAINNFPLAQDTATFDNTGSVTGTITINAAWNIGTFDASARTSAMTLTTSTNTPFVYGNWSFGTGVTSSSTTGTITFAKRGTQTITSNAIAFGCPITIDSVTGTVQLADALTLIAARTLTLTSGTFDAVTYNVTTGLFTLTAGTLKMGSGTWTLSGTGSVWTYSSGTLNKGTANIVLSDTSTTARTFAGGSQSYNKLTIGGTTGISTLTISGNNQFTEIASTKTVAHTIALGATTQTFGAWTVTGTVGNVVTVTGTATITIAGARVSGVDYLALATTVISATSPGEFYAGANSTGGTNAILTAAPTATTRYWRGGTGTWDATTTTNWSTTSGGVSGASVPTSADAVIFDSLSNATAYTVTCTATQLRCAALTFAGPATGNVTWAGTAPLAIHGNFTLPATGLTRSYTGKPTFSGSSTGRTITTNGITLAGNPAIDGVGCGWALGSALSDGGAGSTFTVTNGAFDTANFSFTYGALASSNSNTRSITLGSSTCTVQGFLVGFTNSINLTFSAGTSSISCTSNSSTFNGGGLTFYNVSFTDTATGTQTLNGVNTFNNLSFAGVNSAGLKIVSVTANQTINGTLTLSAGTNATMRQFLQSDTIGTTRTLTCAAFSGTDADFRDITIAGAAAPVSGTRLGDAKGNSGITFGAGVTRYWNLAAGGNWSATGWAATSGGSPAVNNFPLAQDTCLFEATGLNSAATVTVNAAYNMGTINMSARTSNTMTLATGTTTPSIYGNWINGTGTTLSGTGTLTFAGRGSQTITSAGRTIAQSLTINSLGGTVTLQDALVISRDDTLAFWLVAGTFNANNYNVTLSGSTYSRMSSDLTGSRTLALGSGFWTIAGSTTPWSATSSLTITGTGTISLTSASAKTFAGGGISYSGITLDQGGAGALTISGNNTFANISNTYSVTAATTINIGTTTQTVTQFTGTGTVGKVLTIQGASAGSPGTLILSSGTVTTPDYLAITGVRAYNLSSTWYAGANSTNNGSLGWIFSAGASSTSNSNFFFMFG